MGFDWDRIGRCRVVDLIPSRAATARDWAPG
jgi:hypothetical protein